MQNTETDNFIFREIKEAIFDRSLILKNYPFTQANFYGEWQKASGRKVREFVILQGEDTVSYLQAVEYPLMFGKKFVYIPYGPLVKTYSDSLISFIKNNLKRIYSNDAIFVRLDFTPSLNDNESKIADLLLFKVPKFAQNSAVFQPRLEWVLALDKKEDEIFSGMHKNTRYSIRIAEKNNVQSEIIKQDLDKYFDIFYELMQKTAKRNGFSLHIKDYYKTVFESIGKNKNGFLVLSRIKDKVVVAELFVICCDTVTYLFAGSSNEERSACPTYSAQWTAIKYVKSLGLKYYNFGGVAEEGDRKSGWHGLTSFKRKFGGFEVRHSDFYDIVLNYFWYFLYFTLKSIRK